MSAIPGTTREKVKQRDNNQCFRCGAPATNIHHRQRRRVGGHEMSNLIMLCGMGNTSGCHGYVHKHPRWAMDEGFIVSSYSDPTTQWVWRWDGARVILHDDGGTTIVEPDSA